MLDSEDCSLPLDCLFYERPVVHKVKPLFHEQGPWQLEPSPSVSEIPDTKDLQRELEYLCSNDGVTFLPAEREDIRTLKEADESPVLDRSLLWTEECAIRGPNPILGTGYKSNPPQDSGGLIQRSPLSLFCSKNTGGPSQYRIRLFKPPPRSVLESEDACNNMPSENTASDWCGGQVSTATENPFMTSTRSSPSPFTGSVLFSACNPSSSKNDQGTNKACVLPLNPQPLHIQGESGSGVLLPVTEIPAQFRSVFKEFPYFNYIQSKALDDVLYTSRNFVACAPTGSGKTVLFELAIIRLLMETPAPWHSVKIVYMAPIKALCSQRYENWKQKFGPLGLNCKELTGDTEIDDFFEIQEAHLIMTTPEKWDSMTRKWRDNCLVQLVQLFLIDEVHVVKDLCRGATLEVVVSRMKTMNSYRCSENPDKKLMRFVAVSATIPNISDVADWLSDEAGPATCLEMDESHRPVKLRKVVLGFPCGSNQTEFKFDLSLNYKISNIIQTYSDQKPTLVFCSTRKGVQQSASVLAKDACFIMSAEHKQRLMRYANSLLDSKLRDLVPYGIGFHHAGIEMSDRKIIEEAFTLGDLPVLFTTSTLAMGVNLPAHLVVIKSTMHYVGGVCQEYSEMDVLQMIGRAGRPQFDTTASAVIMTRSQTKEKYMQLVSGTETIESSLHAHLVEHLNAEVVLHTISHVNVALDWIRSTFLYIRALKNPSSYGFPASLDRAGIETKLQELCLRNLNALAAVGLITMDEDINFKPTEAGKLMARYCIAFETMKQFSMVSGTETLPDLIKLLSKGKEFSDVQLRMNEKRTLNTLNKDKNRITIRYPMEGKIKNNEMKVNCLIQAQLGSIPVQEFGLTQDIGKIFRTGVRISRCLSEFLQQHSKRNFSTLLNSLILAKCFRAKLWENSPFVSKQLDKIGLALSTAMVNAGLTTFPKIEQTNARELELIVNRHPPFGNQIRDAVIHLPKYEVSLEQAGAETWMYPYMVTPNQTPEKHWWRPLRNFLIIYGSLLSKSGKIPRYSVSTAEIVVTVHIKNYQLLMAKRTAPENHFVSLIIGDRDNNVVFMHKLADSLLLKSGSWSRKVEVTRSPSGEELSVNLISSEFVGLDIQQKYCAFYAGAKKFGAETSTLESAQASQKPQVAVQGNLAVAKRTQGTAHRVHVKSEGAHYPDKENMYPDQRKRHCNHLCKNKEQCGHDCCKVGVESGFKRTPTLESGFSSYLRDLKSRNETLLDTPVKRLKMKMCSQASAVDMHQRDCLDGSRKFEGNHYHLQARAEYGESVDFATLNQMSEEASYYYEEMCNQTEEPEDVLPVFNTSLTKNLKAYKRPSPSNEEKFTYIPMKQNCSSLDKPGLSSADDSGCFSSDNLNVNFDLGIDDWDDFDDENLVHASEISCGETPQANCDKRRDFSTPLTFIGEQNKLSLHQPESVFMESILLQRISSSNIRPPLPQSTTSHTITPQLPDYHLGQGTKQHDSNVTSPAGRFDLFSKPCDPRNVTDITGWIQGEENSSEIEAFRGIFDGIF